MKKTTTILMGLFLCTTALAACGNKKKVELKEPEIGEFGYNIEFKEIYSGRKEQNAKKNFVKALTSADLQSIDAKMTEYQFYSKNDYYTEERSADMTFYSNGFAEEHMETTYTMRYGNFVETETGTDNSIMAKNGNQLIITAETIDEYNRDYEVMIMPFSEEYDVSYPVTSSLAYIDGYFGIDENGNGLMLEESISPNSVTAHTETGIEVDSYDYSFEQTVIYFDGNPETGKPVKMFHLERNIYYYDDNYIVVDEPIMKYESTSKYNLKYGKRKEYKGKDQFFTDIQEEKITEDVSINGMKFQGATISDDKKTITNLPSYPSGTYNYYGVFDQFANNGKKQTGHTYEKSISLVAGDVYGFLFDAETMYAKYDEGTKTYSVQNVAYEDFAEIEAEELPIGLSVVKDGDGKQYLYSTENIYVYVELEWELTLQKVDSYTIIAPKVTIEIVSAPSYIS